MKLRARSWRSASAEKIPALLTMGLLAVLFFAPTSFLSFAADLNGAWATDTAFCSKVFVKNDNAVSFTADADLYGGGFIVDGSRASGTFQKCKIKSMKQSGTTVHLTAACSDGIMVQDAQLTVKLVGPDKITLIIEGVESEENPYVRCRP
jgi:hypothetical protein